MAFLIAGLFFLSGSARAQISADHWNGGAVRVGPSNTNCDGNAAGAIRFDSAANVLKYCDGAAWRTVGTTVSGTDNTPDAFAFTDVTNQPLSTMIFSNVITITGIDPDQTASVTGAGTPQISVNGGPWLAAASVSAGDELQVRLISASVVTTARNAVVTVGTVNDTWTVTTRAGQTQIFMTSQSYTGNLGGLAGADSYCMARAGAASLPGVWRAVMSSSTVDAKDRLNIIYPVVNLGGGTVTTANFFDETWQGHLTNEYSSGFAAYDKNFWHATQLSGLKRSGTCTDWMSTAGNAFKSEVTFLGMTFSDGYAAGSNCSNSYRILCMQQ